MKKRKTFWIILIAVLVAAAVAVTLFFLLRKPNDAEVPAGDTTDTDGDLIPDYMDEEVEDSLDKDNVVDVGDLLP